MAIYEERQPGKLQAALFLIAVFLIIFFPLQLGERELRWDEGYYAAMASEMDILKPNTIAHGEMITSSYPLFPWLAAILYHAGLGCEIGLRIISVLSLATLAVLVWEASRRAIGEEAAMVAAGSLITTLLIIEKGIDGYPDYLGNLFVFCGWISWFTIGAARGRWNTAWIVSFFFCGLAFYTIGWAGIFFFVFPLFFMRRPLTVWSRFKKPGFFLGLAILAGFVIFWFWPRWAAMTETPFRSIPIRPSSFSEYMEHLFFFPFAMFLRFLPWSVFVWPAFCPAYQPLDKNPIFSGFLRRIYWSLFFVFWIMPETEWRQIAILATPLSILTGIHYWLLVRRHGYFLHNLLKTLSYSALFSAIFIIVFYLVPEKSIEDIFIPEFGFGFHTTHRIMGLIQASAAVLTTLFILRGLRKGGIPVWFHAVSMIMAFSLCYWSFVAPYQALEVENRPLAQAIRKAIGEENMQNITIYKEPKMAGLYSMGIYLDCKIRKLKESYNELPPKEKTVYLLGTQYPSFPQREWEYLNIKPFEYKGHRLHLWKGTLQPPSPESKQE